MIFKSAFAGYIPDDFSSQNDSKNNNFILWGKCTEKRFLGFSNRRLRVSFRTFFLHKMTVKIAISFCGKNALKNISGIFKSAFAGFIPDYFSSQNDCKITMKFS